VPPAEREITAGAPDADTSIWRRPEPPSGNGSGGPAPIGSPGGNGPAPAPEAGEAPPQPPGPA
jgi:hypothetical protein